MRRRQSVLVGQKVIEALILLHEISLTAVFAGYMNDEAVAKMMARRGSLDLQHLQQLSNRSHFSYKEIELMYAGFRKVCESWILPG